MDVNDNACVPMNRISFKSIASKLAPTGDCVVYGFALVSGNS